MEKLVIIQKVFPQQERNYTDRNGQQQIFASRGFILSDGIDTFYAEMVGDYARANAKTEYPTDQMHAVQCTIQQRTWKDAQGVERYSNEIRINKLA